MQKFLEESGLQMAFQIVIAEVLEKDVSEEHILNYASLRLKQMAGELNEIEKKLNPPQAEEEKQA